MNALTKEFIKFAAQEKFAEKEGEKWCIRCALGNAKYDFDEKYKQSQMPVGELLMQFADGITKTEYDDILIEARDYLKKTNDDMLFKTKKEAIQFMLKGYKTL